MWKSIDNLFFSANNFDPWYKIIVFSFPNIFVQMNENIFVQMDENIFVQNESQYICSNEWKYICSNEWRLKSVKIYSSQLATLILDTQVKMKRAVVTVSRSFSLYKMKSLIKKVETNFTFYDPPLKTLKGQFEYQCGKWLDLKCILWKSFSEKKRRHLKFRYLIWDNLKY